MDPWVIVIIIAIVIIVIIIVIVAVNNNNNTGTGNNNASVNMSANHVAKYLPSMKVISASNIVTDDLIPHKIHQVWVGSKPVPKHTQDWIKLCAKYGYEYKLWRENDLKSLINQKYFDEMAQRRCFQGCADVARYEVVYQNGGLYIDTDMAPVDLPIFDYLPKTGFAITLEHKHIDIDVPHLKNNRAMFASNQFILSCPKSSILKRVIDSLPVNYESLRSAGHVGAAESTGPYLLTACLFGLFTVVDKNWILVDDHNSKDFHLTEFYYD